MKKITQGKYTFELDQKNGKLTAKIINNNAKKWYNAQVAYYSFRTEEHRDRWVKEMMSRYAAHDKRIAERKAARKNFKNPAKVGDILVSSWGYDQTNIDYYQVIEVKGKSVVIREIGYETMEATHWEQYDVTPAKDKFLKDSKPMLKRVREAWNGDYAVTLNNYSSGSLWDGRPDHKTCYA